MANYKKLVPFILCYEGGYVNDPTDRGGETNKGVTMATWRAYCAKKGKPATSATLKAMKQSEWEEIFKTMYWDKCKGDNIPSQALASMLVDFAWHSGITRAIKSLQMVLSTKPDGMIGSKTLTLLARAVPGKAEFEELRRLRLDYLQNLVRLHPSQKKYIKGWTNRVNALSYEKFKD